MKLTAGEHRLSGTIVRLYEGLPASYGGPNPSKRPAASAARVQAAAGRDAREDREAREDFEKRQAESGAGQRRAGRAARGAGAVRAGARRRRAASLRAGLRCGASRGRARPTCGADDPDAARAPRLPAAVTAADVDPLVGLVARPQARGESFEDGLALALQALLVSPDFLFRIERGRAAGGGRRPAACSPTTSSPRGCRTSSGSACPTTTLLDARPTRASSREPDGARGAGAAHAARTTRRAALVEAFAGQWLQFRALESVAPDRERFPDFDDGPAARDAPRDASSVPGSLLREDRSLLDLLDARYTLRQRAAGAALRHRRA